MKDSHWLTPLQSVSSVSFLRVPSLLASSLLARVLHSSFTTTTPVATEQPLTACRRAQYTQEEGVIPLSSANRRESGRERNECDSLAGTEGLGWGTINVAMNL